MTTSSLRHLNVTLLACSLGLAAQAGEWELGGSFAIGPESKASILDKGAYPTLPYTMVESKFDGPWTQGGISVGYEVIHRGNWGLWLQGQYSEGLVHPAFRHMGETHATGSLIAEEINGTAGYKSVLFGIGVTRRFRLGELGLNVGSRSHELTMEGQRQNKVNGVFTFDHYATSHSSRDMLVSLHFTLVQDQGRFKSFQKFAMGTGFGSALPAVNPGPNDWQMRSAYLARARPNQEFRITLGVRL